MLSVPRGAALYVGALIGPGLLLMPALAAEAAGPASMLAWLALLVISAPIAVTFGVLGVRHPVPGGVAAYVREGLGEDAAAVTGALFLTAVLFGGPAVALIGGYYVAELTGFGGERATPVAVTVGLVMYLAVLGTNAAGLRLSSGVQLLLSSVLVAVVAVAIVVAVPAGDVDDWTPFAPHGWWAVGTATNILVWLIIGWEAMAQLAGEFRDPARDLPRAMACAFAVIAVLYTGLGAATVAVTTGTGSRVPLADLVAVGFGEGGRTATAVIAVVLTMGTMNVYTGSAAKLTADLARGRALPAWWGGDGHRDVPRRPLVALAVAGPCLLGGLAAGVVTTDGLVRATSACFLGVYVLALSSAVRILTGRLRAVALTAVAAVGVVGVFSAGYLLVPAAATLLTTALRRTARRTTARRRTDDGPGPSMGKGPGPSRPVNTGG